MLSVMIYPNAQSPGLVFRAFLAFPVFTKVLVYLSHMLFSVFDKTIDN